MRHKIILLLAALAACFAYCGTAYAADEAAAEQITIQAAASNGADTRYVVDGYEYNFMIIPGGGSLTVSANEGISSLYVQFDYPYGPWVLSDGTTEVSRGEDGFLHEYIDVAGAFGYAPTTLTMKFPDEDCWLSEVYAFGAGQVPDWVQIWEPPLERADLLVVPTHDDDETMYFAGMIPYYAVVRGLAVQVLYFTDPVGTHDRRHEALDGLWVMGIRNYPVNLPIPDRKSDYESEAFDYLKAVTGYTKEDVVRFQVEQLRRFKPLVVAGHDINGEYGHGQHRINARTLMEALELAADESYDPESAALYGVWDTPKAYFHLWPENQLTLDWDEAQEVFGGKSAFNISQEGFLQHKSQVDYFQYWIIGLHYEVTRADQIGGNSPRLFGLYRTTVGLDEKGGDLFEHILPYGERAEAARAASTAMQRVCSLTRATLLAEAEQQAAAAAAAEAEEAARRAEEEARQAAAATATAEPTRAPEEREALTGAGTGVSVDAIIVVIAVAIVVLVVLLVVGSLRGSRRRKRRHKRHY